MEVRAMGEELLGHTDAVDDGQGAEAGEAAGPEQDPWRRGFRDPENWHDLAERGTPRNG